MQFDLVLRTFAEFFEREGIRYALAGGLAVQSWGLRSRATHDVDFVVDLISRERIIAFTESSGFETLHASGGYSNHLHSDSALGRVDFMYVVGETAERVFETAERKSAVGVIVPLVRPELLAAMKATSMKNRPHRVLTDAADVAYLLTIPGVDRAQIRDYFAERGLLDLFDGIERHSQRR
jgi:hypothetical protein